jgi:hypothetical protein
LTENGSRALHMRFLYKNSKITSYMRLKYHCKKKKEKRNEKQEKKKKKKKVAAHRPFGGGSGFVVVSATPFGPLEVAKT